MINKLSTNRGASLYLALIILSILMAIVFGLSSITFVQIKIIKGIGDSIIAFYGADTGIERVLYEGKFAIPSGTFQETLDNDASYQATVLHPGMADCPSTSFYCVKSIGSYRQSKRAIQVTR
jgi:hypothetical protein